MTTVSPFSTMNATILPEFNHTGSTPNPDSIPTLEQLNVEEAERLIPTIVYLAILSVAGIFGNGIVCHVYRTRYRISNSQCFILSLSAIDLFSCSVVIPFEISTILEQYAFTHLWLCKMSRCFNTLGTLASSFLLLFIAIDRYRKVCKPFGWQISSNVAKFLCVLAVVLGIIFSIPAIFIYGFKKFTIPEYGLEGTECSTDTKMASTAFPFLNAVVFGFLCVSGIIIMSVLYCLIGREVHRHANRIPGQYANGKMSISSTMDARDSRISGEIDAKTLAKLDLITAKSNEQKRASKVSNNMKYAIENEDLSYTIESSGKYNNGFTHNRLSEEVNMEELSETSDTKHDTAVFEDSNESDKNRNTSDIPDTNHVVDSNEESSDSRRTANETEPPDANHTAENDNKQSATAEKTSALKSAFYTKKPNRSVSISPTASEEEVSSKSPRKYLRSLSSISSRLSNAVSRLTSITGSGVSNTDIGYVRKAQYLKQARARKTAFLMFVISIVFVISYLPHLTLMLVRQIKSEFVEDMSDENRAVYKFFLRSYFLNCAVNPIIYGVCDSRFRAGCKEMFAKCCRRA